MLINYIQMDIITLLAKNRYFTDIYFFQKSQYIVTFSGFCFYYHYLY